MKDYNLPISDNEIRELLKGRLMTHNIDDILNEQLMNMEAKIAFANVPFIAPSLQKEKELIKRLNKQFGNPFSLKWLFTGMGTIAIIATVVISKNNPNKPATNSTFAPVMNKTEEPLMQQKEPMPMIEVPEKSASYVNPLQNNPLAETETLPSENAVLNLYKDIPSGNPSPLPQNNTFSPFSIADAHNSGELHNLSDEKNQISIDTLFAGIKQLEVNALYCNLNVKSAPGDKISLKAVIKYELKGLHVKKPIYKFRYERTGVALKVWVENEGKENNVIIGNMYFEGFLNFEVPEKTEVVLKNMSGNISVKGMSGPVCNIETNFGNIWAEEINTNVNLKSLSGDIHSAYINGKIINKGSYGNMTFDYINGDINATSGSGNIDASNVDGDMDIEAKYGDINIEQLKGLLKINSSSGNISLSDIKGKDIGIIANYGHVKIINSIADIRVTSKSGDLNLEKITGNISMTSLYGNQHISGISGNITSVSTSGNITISQCAGTFDINSVYGSVNLSECAGKMVIYVQSGDINGKNINLSESLSLRTNYGNIHMNLKNKIDDLSFDLASTSGQIKIDKDGYKKTVDEGSFVLTKGHITIKGITLSGNQSFD